MMLLKVVILMPGEPDNRKIKYGEQYEKDGVRVGITIDLVHDKEREHNDGGRVCPQFVA